jgi:hypothetical protein
MWASALMAVLNWAYHITARHAVPYIYATSGVDDRVRPRRPDARTGVGTRVNARIGRVHWKIHDFALFPPTILANDRPVATYDCITEYIECPVLNCIFERLDSFEYSTIPWL